MRKAPSHCQAYLLRYGGWTTRAQPLHASLHDERTGGRLCSASLHEAVACLRQQLEPLPGPREPYDDRDTAAQQNFHPNM